MMNRTVSSRWLGTTLLLLALATLPAAAVTESSEELVTRLDEALQAPTVSVDQLWPELVRDAEQLGLDDPGRLAVLERLGKLLLSIGEPRETVRFWDEAIALRRDSIPAGGTVELAKLLAEQADVLIALESHERAEGRLREAIEVRTAMHGEKHHTVRALLRKLSQVIREARADDPEAESLLLQIHDLRPGYDSHRELGRYYRSRGEYDRAVEQLTSALELAERDARNGLRRLPQALTELADTFREAGSAELAETYYLRALEAREAQYGETHPYLARSLRQLGEYFMEQERWVDAELHLRRALGLKQSAYGECDVCNRDVVTPLLEVHAALGRDVDFCPAGATAASSRETHQQQPELEELGAQFDELLRRREYARAQQVAQRGLELREERWGPQSLEATRSLLQLARVAGRLKRTEEEITFRQRILDSYELGLGPEHPATAGALSALGHAAKRAEQPDSASRYWQRESEVREAAGQTMLLARALTRLGRGERERGDERAAAERFLRAADLWEQVAGRDAREYVDNRVDLAASYVALNLGPDAETVLSELIEAERDRAAPRYDVQARILQSLEPLVRQTGREEEADALAADLERVRKLRDGR